MKKFLKNPVLILIISLTIFSCNKNTNEKNLASGDSAAAALSDEMLPVNGSENITETTRLPPRFDIFQYIAEHYKGECFIRVWGWSRDGKVAYSVDSSSPARGGFVIDYYIMNIITDEILFHLKIDSFDYSAKINEYEHNDYNASVIYSYNSDKIIAANVQHNIIEDHADFLSFPIMKNNYQYICFADVKETEESGMVRAEYNIIVSRDENSKIIGSNSEYGPSISIHICGYFISPYENRILVVYASTSYFSGNTFIGYQFSGCHLDAGF